jgi:GR25 family glycosyltransferase involved in LPS biosynthesis
MVKTFVINLDRRKDRLETLMIPFEWERFAAIDALSMGQPGYVGCLLSHRTILKKIRDLKLESAIIFEDDVELCDDFENKFNEILKKLPENWDLLYLGGWNRTEPEKYCDGLNVVKRVLCMHAYMVRDKFIDTIIEALHSTDNIPEKEKKPEHLKCDVLLANYLPKGKCFICDPPLVWQKEGYSDIECQVTNNLHLKDSKKIAVVVERKFPLDGTTAKITLNNINKK